MYNSLRDFCIDKNIETRFNEPMSLHTSLKIGGRADVVVFPKEEELPDLISFLNINGLPYVIIGGGTNLLILDGGIEGVVIFTERMDKIMNIDGGRLTVQGGCSLQRVISLCAELGLSGMEGLAGIPGSIGGAIVGNSGSFGYEIKDNLEYINVISTDSTMRKIFKSELGFKYRGSNISSDCIITSATFTLEVNEPAEVRKVTKQFLNEKRIKQPLNQPSAGCVFKNFDGLSAGKLIDEAGCKGLRVGGIQVSNLHANYFINTGKGSAEEFLRLMDIVNRAVKEKFNIVLEPEIKIIGRF
ncbi:MAG: UDP-N-acetylmuramate dehydrogenase [Thermodesulfovibrionales bacterium]|nr:UDP-N-acetylmuramate dehydrogenase [Thermodesulfovibrionales bacterium]